MGKQNELVEDLLSQGYAKGLNKSCQCDHLRFFHKQFSDHGGLKYHLSFKEYDVSLASRGGGMTYSADFRVMNANGMPVDVYFRRVEEFGLAEIERQAEEIWRFYGSVYPKSLEKPSHH